MAEDDVTISFSSPGPSNPVSSYGAINSSREARTRCSSQCVDMNHDVDAHSEAVLREILENGHVKMEDIEDSLSHCHTKKDKLKIDTKAKRKLILASVLCLLFMIAEIVGGVLAHSLAIVSDAAHLLTDFASFMISLLALYLASRMPTNRMSFGWYRAEILGALMSIVFLWILTGILFYLAVKRVTEMDYKIDATVMLITASCGVAFNIIMGLTLHQHGHNHSHGNNKTDSHGTANADNPTPPQNHGNVVTTNENTQLIPKDNHKHTEQNINVKAAFIHVVGDLIQSIGVLIAAIIIFVKPEWKIADPICTFLFSVLVMLTTLTIFRDIVNVLMEGAPKGYDITAVRKSFYKIPGVKDVHDLRMWSLSMDKIALSVHVAVDADADPIKILKLSSAMVRYKYEVVETTIQVEEYVDDMMDCTHCQDPQ